MQATVLMAMFSKEKYAPIFANFL